MRILPHLILASSLLSAGASAYPIQPQSLWTLTSESDRIIVGVVENFAATQEDLGSYQGERPHSDAKFTRIRVETVLKGDAGDDHVDVELDTPYTCPAPALYVVGYRVVAFLVETEGPYLRTAGRSYGTRYPSHDELEPLLADIRTTLSTQTTEGVSETTRLAWAVRAAVDPRTRQEGIWELTNPRDSSGSARATIPQIAELLTDTQREDLNAVILREHLPGRNLLEFIKILGPTITDAATLRAIDIVLATAIEQFTVGQQTFDWPFAETVARLAVRTGDSRALERYSTLRHNIHDEQRDFTTYDPIEGFERHQQIFRDHVRQETDRLKQWRP